MADQVVNYQCPACTGPLHFDETSGKLKCDYCDSEFTVEEIARLYSDKEQKAETAFQQEEQKAAKTSHKKMTASAGQKSAKPQPDTTGRNDSGDWDASDMTEDWGRDSEKMRVYNCPSCGAELICEETTAASSCPYCGNPSIVPGQLSGTLKPDYIIPFKLDKKHAVEALKNHYKGKFLLPKEFKTDNHLEEVQGIYVPFWLFDTNVEAQGRYEATRSHVFRQGDYRITETEIYDVYRAGEMSFTHIPVDASSKMQDDYMDSIEPFDFREMKAFSTAYLPGYLADRYDVSAAECSERADVRCKSSVQSVMQADVVGYDLVRQTQEDTRIHRGKVCYALMPVWTLHTKWNDRDYLFMMNGQNGRMVGDLPVSGKKKWLTFLVCLLLTTGLFLLTGVGRFMAELIWEIFIA